MSDPSFDNKSGYSPKSIFFPTTESCWEFGIQRHPRSMIPILDSLTPYKFLRGVQFDTKVFQLSELLSLLNIFNKPPSSEIVLKVTTDLEDVKKALMAVAPFPKVTKIGNKTSFSTDIKTIFTQAQVDAIYTIAKTTYQSLYQYQISILPNWQDSMPAITISHDWGAGDDILTNVMNSVNTMYKNINEIGRSIGGVRSSIPYIKDRYKSSKLTEFTVPILLFTKDNFVRDIFNPLMALIYFSSARSNDESVSQFQSILNQAAVWLEKKISEEVDARLKQGAVDALEWIKGGIDAANAIVGTKSMTVLPPPTWSVSSDDKTINMARAAIVSVSYQFKGPYIKAGYKGLFGQLFGSLGPMGDIGASLDRLLRDEYVKIFKFKDNAFPSICEINITLKETAFIDGDEYYKKALNMDVGTISISSAAETSTSVMIASGIAQNIGVVLPETRGTGDLLGGGKWVPPGESLTGIPGFL
jgi:hypothetical protein